MNPPWLAHPALWPSLWTVSEGGDRDGDAAEPTARDRVAWWERAYDTLYEHPGGPFGQDFTGWYSPVDGRCIPEEQMRRWRDGTVDRIRRLGGSRVLEIGAGSGLLLAELAPACRSYWATDLSPVVADRLREQVTRAGLADRTVVRCQPADDLSGLPTGEFDTVVLNSVVQDFPSTDYLLDVVRGAIGLLAPGGVVHIGDVRRLDLLRAFRVSVRLGRLAGAVWPERLGAAQREGLMRRLRDLVDQDVSVEGELMAEPDLFATMPGHLPGATGVEVWLKDRPDPVEVAPFRYDVTIHTGPGVIDVERVPTWEWGSQVDGVSALTDRLRRLRPFAVRVAGIPNAGVSGPVAAAAALVGGRSLDGVRSALAAGGGLRPADLERAARDAGFRCGVTWSRRGLDLADAVLFPGAGPRPRLTGVFVPEALPSVEWPRSEWTNRPLAR